jgi:ankyrin repeat protein
MVGPEMLLRVQTTIPYASETYNFCANGNVKALQRLFEEGLASPFDVDPRGVSLLHNALRFDHYSTCRLLISCGSDLYLEDQYVPNCNSTSR